MSTSSSLAAHSGPAPKFHEWRVDEREYTRQEERRGGRFAYNTIEPEKTALVVIDMVPFFVKESGYCTGIVPNIKSLAASLRAAGGTVAWVVPGAGFLNPGIAKEFFGEAACELFKASGGSGGIAERVWPPLEPMDSDLFFEKKAYSAFFPGSSDVSSTFKADGIDTVIIAGTLTNICCESSARDAFSEGFRVIFMADATAARRDQDHNAALYNIYRSFGDVRSTSEVLDLITETEVRL